MAFVSFVSTESRKLSRLSGAYNVCMDRLESASSTRIYQLKIFLQEISPINWRRLLVSESTSLMELHEVFQIDFQLTKILTKTTCQPAAANDARATGRRGRSDFTTVHGGPQQSVSESVE